MIQTQNRTQKQRNWGSKVKNIGSSGKVVRIGGWSVRFKDQAGIFISIIT
jgi:hypothetical protein